MKLTDAQRLVIMDRIESLFEGTKARLLGKYFSGPRLYYEVVRRADPLDTIEGIYNFTLKTMFGASAKPDEQQVENLAEITSNYMDAQQLKIKNKILADVANAETPSQAIRSIREHFDAVGRYVDGLVSNEVRIVQAYASREGITKLASDLEVEDPTVVFLGVCDHKICRYCKSMYHDSANMQRPKPYKLSQVREGYFRAKDWDGRTPHQAPLHPNCRHTMSFVPPNFGFDAAGNITFIEIGYDYFEDYWKTKKSEEMPSFEILEKSDFVDYEEYLEWSVKHEECCGERAV